LISCWWVFEEIFFDPRQHSFFVIFQQIVKLNKETTAAMVASVMRAVNSVYCGGTPKSPNLLAEKLSDFTAKLEPCS